MLQCTFCTFCSIAPAFDLVRSATRSASRACSLKRQQQRLLKEFIAGILK